MNPYARRRWLTHRWLITRSIYAFLGVFGVMGMYDAFCFLAGQLVGQ